MNTLAPLVVRCGTCGGWLVRRALHSEEPPTIALVCTLCGLDLELIDGALVPVAHPATPDTASDRARHDHAARNVDGMLRRRGKA